MFNVGGGELLVIALLALIVLGPDKLPEAARKVGAVMAELRRMSAGFKQEVREVIDFGADDPAPTTPPGPYLVGPPAAAETGPTGDARAGRERAEGDATGGSSAA
jgi:Tat protein translocase TatB subunit